MCCANNISVEENKTLRVGHCPDCGGDVDKDGNTLELDDCGYSPLLCNLCGYHPCDQSC